MSNKNLILDNLKSKEEVFRNIRKSVLDNYQEKLTRRKNLQKIVSESNKKISQEEINYIKKCGIDINQLSAIKKKEAKNFEDGIKKINEKLSKRDVDIYQKIRDRIIHANSMRKMNVFQPIPIGADILTSEKKFFHIKSHNNPCHGAGWFEAQGDIDGVKVEAQNTILTPVDPLEETQARIHWWFYWEPPEDKTYGVHFHFRHHGFYTLQAGPSLLFPGQASAQITWNFQVYNPSGPFNANGEILNRIVINETVSELLPETTNKFFYLPLSIGSIFGGPFGAILLFELSFEVSARGFWTYSLIDCTTGSANYLQPPEVFFSW